jgi:hypothetical protein
VKFVVVAAAALAATPAPWKHVTAPGAGRVGAVRSADGVLHVAWRNGGDLFHTAIRASGKVGATAPIATAEGTDPAIVAVPGGLRVFWGDPGQQLDTAFSADGGASWQLTPVVQAAAENVSATATLQAWAGPLGTFVHAGLDASTPSVSYGPGGADPELATDAGGRTMLTNGAVVQGVNPDGSPDGAPMTMPGAGATRTPIVARAKSGGFYVAYAVGDDVRVWNVGSANTLDLGSGRTPSLAADAQGRIWAVWAQGAHVFAARSDRDVTEFGASVDAGAARDATALDASATGSALDVLAQFAGATSVTRVLPGLTLQARRHVNQVTFSVTDAGDPRRGARVRAAGRAGKTDRNGRVTLTLRTGATAIATLRGYTRATLKVKAPVR